jgi:pimeloyl-ACP methyl ester carboxylesterase
MATVLPLAGVGLDAAVASINTQRQVRHAVRSLIAKGVGLFNAAAGGKLRPDAPSRLAVSYVPVDTWLKVLERALAKAELHPVYDGVVRRVNWLSNPARVRGADIGWLLRVGGAREPRKVIAQFGRWIRRGEFRCYRADHDFKKGLSNITIPMAIIFGDMDPLASMASTRSAYRSAKSEYLVWRPVKGNSHIELTMGHDTTHICRDVRSLVEYAVARRSREPSPERPVGLKL